MDDTKQELFEEMTDVLKKMSALLAIMILLLREDLKEKTKIEKKS